MHYEQGSFYELGSDTDEMLVTIDQAVHGPEPKTFRVRTRQTPSDPTLEFPTNPSLCGYLSTI